MRHDFGVLSLFVYGAGPLGDAGRVLHQICNEPIWWITTMSVQIVSLMIAVAFLSTRRN